MKNCIALLGLSLLCALPQAAQAQTVTPPIVPPGLEVDAPDQAFLLGHATGFQNYECQPVGSLGRVDWVLFTPQATLFNDQNEQIIGHFNSPNPDEARVGTRHVAGLSGYEHGLGARSRRRDGRPQRDSLGEVGKSRSAGGTDRRQDALRHDVRPAGEHARRPCAIDRL